MDIPVTVSDAKPIVYVDGERVPYDVGTSYSPGPGATWFYLDGEPVKPGAVITVERPEGTPAGPVTTEHRQPLGEPPPFPH